MYSNNQNTSLTPSRQSHSVLNYKQCILLEQQTTNQTALLWDPKTTDSQAEHGSVSCNSDATMVGD